MSWHNKQQHLKPNTGIKLNLWIIFGNDRVERLENYLSIPHMAGQAILSVWKSEVWEGVGADGHRGQRPLLLLQQIKFHQGAGLIFRVILWHGANNEAGVSAHVRGFIGWGRLLHGSHKLGSQHCKGQKKGKSQTWGEYLPLEDKEEDKARFTGGKCKVKRSELNPESGIKNSSALSIYFSVGTRTLRSTSCRTSHLTQSCRSYLKEKKPQKKPTHQIQNL